MLAIACDSDEKLVERLRHGDQDAYEVLFERHWDNAFQMIYARTGDKIAAEEMTQDIFMKLWDMRAVLSINNFSAYLYTAVKNKSLNFIEARITRKKFREYYERFLPLQEDVTERAVALNDLRQALEKGLSRIPEKSKIVFTLSRLEGYTVKEISRKLNLSEKAIEYHLTRSVKELRLRLKDFMIVGLAMLMG